MLDLGLLDHSLFMNMTVLGNLPLSDISGILRASNVWPKETNQEDENLLIQYGIKFFCLTLKGVLC